MAQVKDCKQVETLLGPIELDILDFPGFGNRIVLLGDHHKYETKCPPDSSRCATPVFLYLDRLFQEYNSLKYLDFFLELEHGPLARHTHHRETQYQHELKKGTSIVDDYIKTIAVYFWDCFRRKKTKCEFYDKPIRFHYADVRTGVIQSTMEKDERILISQMQFRRRPIKKLTTNNIEPYLKLLQRLQKRDVDFLFRYGKIDKQLQKIKNEELVKLLKEYLVAYINEYQKVINELIVSGDNLFISIFIDSNSVDVRAVRQFQYNVVAYTLSPLFDIYTLARIFRHDMQRVIIYAGAAHTRRIRDFLLGNFKFKHVAHEESGTKGKSFQCISLKNVPQPWFPNEVKSK